MLEAQAQVMHTPLQWASGVCQVQVRTSCITCHHDLHRGNLVFILHFGGYIQDPLLQIQHHVNPAKVHSAARQHATTFKGKADNSRSHHSKILACCHSLPATINLAEQQPVVFVPV